MKLHPFHSIALVLLVASFARAETHRVPQDFATIQAAIEAARSGDVVLVAAGRYKERLQLKPGVTLRSEGDDARGELGLKRAEATIIDGEGAGDKPGVSMAQGGVLDGFTITNVGVYDDEFWQKHHASHGEELGDDEGSVQAEGTVAAVAVIRVNCRVVNNVVHHNGDVGVAIVGSKTRTVAPLIEGNVSYRNMGGGIGAADFAEPIVRENTCFENLRAGIGCRNSSPLILNNTCYKNIRAGIGCREGATPVVRGNQCYANRRAGIGVRMAGTTPVVERNRCYENDMAGIGSRDGAEPIVRNNECFRNKMAGIGCDGSKPLIVGNQCRENDMAGIGMRGQAEAMILNNHCVDNKLVAIGVTQQSKALIAGNELSRTGGVPPIIAVKDESQATIFNNEIKGGGVAAVLVQGRAAIFDNHFQSANEKQGKAVWVWQGSDAAINGNSFHGYRSAVNASKAMVSITNNKVEKFGATAIVVRDSASPAHITGNTAWSNDPDAQAVQITGPAGVVESNVLKAVK